jgi:hypothetical protein
MPSKLLTKSKYLLGLQCPKLLWIAVNDKTRIPKPDEIAQKKFDDGTLVGELATTWYPNGVNLADEEFGDNLEKTKELLKKKVPIFEAGFIINGLYSRADILVPVGSTDGHDSGEPDEWDIIEVKSATKVKDVNLHDVAFQKHVYEESGLKINRCYLMHINNGCVRDGEIEPKELFIQTDITEKVEEFSEGLEKRIEKMKAILNGKEPECKIGACCGDPYPCPIKAECWKDVPENSVFDLYRYLKKKATDLYHSGVREIKDIPEDVKLNEKQQIQRRLANEAASSTDMTLEGPKHIDKQEIKNFMNNLQYPIYYLDFETINPIIPKFGGMKPYQRIPFQFSLHIQEEKGGELKHISFLAEGTNDPRLKFLQALKDGLGEKGSILVYNQGFEKGVFREGVGAFLEFKKWYMENIEPRIMDLWDVFRNFYYYDPRQKGSASIKAVLPVMSDLSYKDLEEVKKGDQASYEYERVTFGDISDEEREKIRKALEEYCKLDTLAEVEIVEKLWGVVDGP